MHHVGAKYVPRLLSEDRKQDPDISKEHVDRTYAYEYFLKNIVTGWDFDLQLLCRIKSPVVAVGLRKATPTPKALQIRSNAKAVLPVFIDWEGVIHHEFVLRSQTVNKEFYLKIMKRWGRQWGSGLIYEWKKGFAPSWQQSGPGVPSGSLFSQTTWDDARPQPPYSPDLARADLFTILEGQRFESVMDGTG